MRMDQDVELPVVLEGSLEQAPLCEVLDVIGMSRQVMELVLSDDAGVVGTIVVASGEVVEARVAASGAAGRGAFGALFASPGTRFTVLRRSREVPGLTLGAVDELVAEAKAARDAPEDSALGPLPTIRPRREPTDARVEELEAQVRTLRARRPWGLLLGVVVGVQTVALLIAAVLLASTWM